MTGELKATPPELTAEKLAGLGIKERVSTFTTRFTGGWPRRAARTSSPSPGRSTARSCCPGKTFSLNGHTGERGYAQGYRDAPVILDGKLVPGVGGGTSQFTTTLFNATYYAGLEDVEHKPHSYWFDRYPAVIESTIFWPNLDFKFRNNTEYGVLIDTSYTSSSVTVSIWSTKIYDSVKTEYGPRRNITTPKLIHLEPGPTCIATQRHQRLHPGRLPRHQEGRQGGQAGEVHLALRRGAPLRLRPEALLSLGCAPPVRRWRWG